MAAGFLLSGDERLQTWGCSECKGPEWAEGDAMRESRNCDGAHPSAVLHFDWAPELDRCPFAAISDDAWRYVGLWCEHKNLDVLPEPGGLAEQPAATYQAVAACESALGRLEQRRMREHQATVEQMRARAATKRGG